LCALPSTPVTKESNLEVKSRATVTAFPLVITLMRIFIATSWSKDTIERNLETLLNTLLIHRATIIAL